MTLMVTLALGYPPLHVALLAAARTAQLPLAVPVGKDRVPVIIGHVQAVPPNGVMA
jgi:hypothetical protein